MITFPYKTHFIHCHVCDVCGHLIKDMCSKNYKNYDELCQDCLEEYERYLEKQEKVK